MRYLEKEKIPESFRVLYQERKHILNNYYSLDKEKQWEDSLKYIEEFPLVYLCGSRFSSLCSTCGNCIFLYFVCKEKIKNE